MIRGIFQLDKTIAREIMTPRVDMTTAELSTSIEDVARVMLTHGHSKIPVYKTNIDKIEGIAYSMDILRIMSNFDNSRIELANFLRPVLFIPESKTLEDLLTDFQEKHLQMAIVVDEYGGVSGLVTVEDIVEEIVGEIHDEFDRGVPRIKSIGKNQFHVDAGISIDDLKDQIGAPFEGEGFDTLGGFVLHQLGKIPNAGDSLHYNGIHIHITSTSGRRLRSLRLTVPQNQLGEYN